MSSLHAQLMRSIGVPSLMHFQGEKGSPARVTYISSGGQEVECDAIVGPISIDERDATNNRSRVERRWVLIPNGTATEHSLTGIETPQLDADLWIGGQDNEHRWSVVDLADVSDSYRRIWVERHGLTYTKGDQYRRPVV